VRGPRLGVLPLSAADGAFAGLRPEDNLGQALAVLADDANTSVLIGVPHAEPEYAGATFAWPGTVSGDADPGSAATSIHSTRAGAHAGTSLSSGCDADGDGTGDLLVGAWGDDMGLTGGAAYLVRGPLAGAAPALEAAAAIYVSATPGAAAGSKVLLADLDASGRCDVLIGAPGEGNGGVVYGFLDRSEGELTLDQADFRAVAAHPGDSVGTAFTASDQDGDGYLDLWIGAPGHDEAGDGSGAVFIVYGPPQGAIVLDETQPRLLGRAEGDHFGAALASGGDLDGDGSHDVAIGAWGRGMDAENNRGAVFVFRNADVEAELGDGGP